MNRSLAATGFHSSPDAFVRSKKSPGALTANKEATNVRLEAEAKAKEGREIEIGSGRQGQG
jgi:hypothetical protein